MLVISSAGFLTNPFARSGQGMEMGGQFAMMGPVGGDEQLQMIAGPYAQKYLTGTILSFKNTLDWMSGDSDLIAASAKLLSEANLTYGDITRPKIDASDDDNSIKKKDEEYRAARKTTQSNVQLGAHAPLPGTFRRLRHRPLAPARGGPQQHRFRLDDLLLLKPLRRSTEGAAQSLSRRNR